MRLCTQKQLQVKKEPCQVLDDVDLDSVLDQLSRNRNRSKGARQEGLRHDFSS